MKNIIITIMAIAAMATTCYNNVNTATSTSIVEEVTTIDHTIVITAKNISIDGMEISLEMMNVMLSTDGTDAVKLIDNFAVASTYKDVMHVCNTLGIEICAE